MKTLVQLSKGSGILTTTLFLLLTIIIGCAKQEMTPESLGENFNKSDSRSQISHQGTILLQGFTRFAFFAAREGRVITDGYTTNFLECQAELIFIDKQNFVLNTTEIVPGIGLEYRKISFKGKITPSGQLKFSWPETWLEFNGEALVPRTGILAQVRLHTGMDISGQGISKNTLNYMGSFDGEKLFADMHIIGQQKVPGTMDFFVNLVEGPVMINFMIDLGITE